MEFKSKKIAGVTTVVVNSH